MTDRDAGAFRDLMLSLGEVYREEVQATRIRIYFTLLAEFTIAQVAEAAFVHMRQSKFFPMPAELRAAVRRPPEDWYGECGRLHDHACALDRYQHLERCAREAFLARQS